MHKTKKRNRSQVKRDNTERRHRMVYEHYQRLYNIKAGNVRKFSHEYILDKCREKFGYSCRTIENIILKQT